MIGYDFDGIFIPDIALPVNSASEVYQKHRNIMFPIFTPNEPYFIVTGRPEEDRKSTMEYIERYFPVQPVCVHHMPSLSMNVLEYKANVLSSMDPSQISFYLESDRITANYLKIHVPNVRIVLFSEMIGNILHVMSMNNPIDILKEV